MADLYEKTAWTLGPWDVKAEKPWTVDGTPPASAPPHNRPAPQVPTDRYVASAPPHAQPAPKVHPEHYVASGTTGGWGARVNAAMNALRGHGAQAAAGMRTGWDAISPQNQQTLRNLQAGAHRAGGTALRGGLLAGGLYAGYRMLGGGARTADEQRARMQDYLSNAQHQMDQPLPSMTVMASYDEFAKSAHAFLDKTAADRVDTFNTAHGALSSAFGQALAQKLVTEPIDNAHRFLKKKIVDEPKAHATFHSVVQADPMLRDAYAENPAGLEDTFKAMQKFGPSMVSSPAVVRSFLRQSTMAGGNMDFATIRLLAETEKFVQNSRGRGGGT